jgi:molybdopterin-containing oxidoreductase family membrane subunit
MSDHAARPGPLVSGGHGYASMTDKISDTVLVRRFGWVWWGAFLIALGLTTMFFIAIVYLFYKGVGIWGINIPVAWSFAITNYVWWIGIGMAGTFISAALLVLRQEWRAAINRTAEAMTVFAVSIAGIFPILHLGRPEFFYWLVPYPGVMNLWPQWRSSLVWDFYALLAYLIVSILFFYVGMLPDLATFRDQARRRGVKIFYGLLALGWRGEARDWSRHERLVLILAALAVVLVFSVHSMVGFDFSEALIPGWHSTMLPPYFVAGALYSGFALVLCLVIPMRRAFGFQDFITAYHLDNIAKLTLVLCQFMTYSYLSEIFMAYYSGDVYEIAMTDNRFFGLYAPVYWITITCNSIIPQLLWFPRIRRSTAALFIIGALIVIGMWLERFMLIVTSLYQDFLPSAWGKFVPTAWDWIHLIGSMGLFALLFLLFIRLLPAIAMYDMRKILEKKPEHGA